MRAAAVLVVGLIALAAPQMALADVTTDTESAETTSSSVTCGGDPIPITTALSTADDACAGYSLGSCKTVTAWRKRVSSVGITVWKYWQRIYFCWRYPQITYLSRTRGGTVYTPCCWDYQGHIGNSTSWNAKWSYRAFTEGRFYWNGPPWPMTRTPEINMTVYGNGSWTYSTSN
jgi:hypothetical protein